MYSGILRLTPDTVNITLVVATQLEMSTVIELCKNFIANPHCPDPSGEKEHAGRNSSFMAQDDFSDILCMDKPTVKGEKETSVSAVQTCPPDALMCTTRSSSYKLQATQSSESSEVNELSATSSNEQTVLGRNSFVRMKHAGTTKTSQQSSLPKVHASSQKEDDPDWKPTMDSCSPVHRYNTRKRSLPTVCKSVSSAHVSDVTVHRKNFFSSSDVNHPLKIAQKYQASGTKSKGTASTAVYCLPAWQQSRKMLLAARVFLAKRIKVTNAGSLSCRQCHVEAFTSRSYLAAHVHSRHRLWHYCFSCGRRSVSFLSLIRHRNIKHHYFSRTRLPKSLSKKSSVKSPLSSSSTTGSLHNKCGWCGLKFSARSKLVEHRKTVHRKRTDTVATPACRRVMRDWHCIEKECGMEFKQKDKLCLHMAEHHPTVIFSCPECRFKTQVEHILKRHLTRRHHERHSCHMCGKAYHKPFLLRVHMYNRHKVTDPSLKLYHCPHEGCDYACPSKNGMNLHVLKHAQPDAFACEVCGKTFKREAGLDKHMSKIHLGIRPYICDKCGISYSDEPELRMHLARHAESKPYSCNFCSYSTFQKSSLKSHLFCRHQVLMDSDMAVLRCDDCSFVTDKRCRFDDHVKMHQNIRDIPCTLCGKLFVTKKTRRQHIIKVHRRAAAATTRCSPAATPGSVTSRPLVIPTQVQSLKDELQSADDVTVAETNAASQELFTATDVIDNLNMLSFQSPTVSGFDHIAVQSSVTPVEYQMLMPLSTSGVPATTDGTASLTQVAAVSGAGPIIVGISLPTADSMATYQTIQPFDLQNARILL